MFNLKRRFHLRDSGIRQRAADFVSSLPLEPVYEVLIQEYRRPRTIKQNARMWALHKAAADETGHTIGELHEAAKQDYYGTVEVFGRVVARGGTHDKNTKEHSNFTAWLESRYANMGIVIPAWTE